MKKYKFILLSVFFALSVQAQTAQKTERETRIDKTNFPAKAKAVLAQFCTPQTPVKYYKEIDVSSTYEAKFKHNRQRYSIEFDSLGRLQDIEVTVRKKAMGKPALERLKSQLDSMARRSKIEKVQAQYLPQNQRTIAQMKEAISAGRPNYYELIVALKDKRKIRRVELLIDPNGEIKLMRNVQRLAYDFLLF